MSRIRLFVVAGAGICLLLTGCGSNVGDSADTEVVGRWVSDEPGDPHLVLDAEGKVKGSDGCNGINTTYTVEGNVVTLASRISTLRACVGVDTWLSGASTLRISGDEAAVFNRDGEEIGTLVRINS
ncbi:META domain-containing protein [Brevibacterium daeguense]|uniref:META domain-containing protein n=2 Tax=Brevibacterium daeguense TaxID=909936 RepID=A0ABP8EGP4_9MICO